MRIFPDTWSEVNPEMFSEGLVPGNSQWLLSTHWFLLEGLQRTDWLRDLQGHITELLLLIHVQWSIVLIAKTNLNDDKISFPSSPQGHKSFQVLDNPIQIYIRRRSWELLWQRATAQVETKLVWDKQISKPKWSKWCYWLWKMDEILWNQKPHFIHLSIAHMLVACICSHYYCPPKYWHVKHHSTIKLKGNATDVCNA